MSTLELKELSHPSGEVIKIAAGKTLDLHSQGTTKMPAGSVIQTQYIQSASPSHYTTTSTSFVSMGVSVSITPKYANSKIFIQFTSGGQELGSAAGTSHATIYRGSTHLGGTYGMSFVGNYSVNGSVTAPHSIAHMDSPNTTSATTYTLYGKASTAGTAFIIHTGVSYALIVQEIAQ